jgi:cyanate lyase
MEKLAMKQTIADRKIVALKQLKGISWIELTKAIGRSRGFATAALASVSLDRHEA